jgi:glycosyltransferase involved in cell wall biosynthesis
LKQRIIKKNILVLTSTFPRWMDDVEPPFVYELCRRLTDEFHVHVLAPHAPGAETQEQLAGIQVTRYRYFFSRWESLAYNGGILANLKQNPLRFGLIPFFVLLQLWALLKLIQRYRFDCIHAHWLIPQGFIALMARWFCRSAPPLVTTSHGGDLFGLNGFVFNRLMRRVAKHSAAVTVVSRIMRDVLRALTVDEDRIHVIPMGVDLSERFVPSANRRDQKVMLFVGRLVEKKGLAYLIDALPTILARHPSAKLKIVGDGQERAALENRVTRLKLNRHVEFLGAAANESLPAIYRASDVVVFPSVVAGDGDREGFGLVLVEALGCECATVVTDLPAMRDIVTDDQTALVVPQKDSGKLAERIVDLLNDPQLRRRLGKAGREYVLQRFDWRIIAKQYTDLMHSVIV